MAELVKGMEGLTVTTPAEIENITGAFTKEDMDAFQEVTSALRKLELTEPGITAHDVRELVCQHPPNACTRSNVTPHTASLLCMLGCSCVGGWLWPFAQRAQVLIRTVVVPGHSCCAALTVTRLASLLPRATRVAPLLVLFFLSCHRTARVPRVHMPCQYVGKLTLNH
jgi:hypothetical protein